MPTYKNFDDLFKGIEKEIKKNPNRYLDEQTKEKLVGQKTTGFCPNCNLECDVEILKGGKVKCLKCEQEFDLNIKWDIK
jgi:hypothetical protein